MRWNKADEQIIVYARNFWYLNSSTQYLTEPILLAREGLITTQLKSGSGESGNWGEFINITTLCEIFSSSRLNYIVTLSSLSSIYWAAISVLQDYKLTFHCLHLICLKVIIFIYFCYLHPFVSNLLFWTTKYVSKETGITSI